MGGSAPRSHLFFDKEVISHALWRDQKLRHRQRPWRARDAVRLRLYEHCENCFQPQTWDFCYGKPFTGETEDELIRLLSPDYINGLTLLGGEPFEPKNQRALLPFLRRVRRELPQKTIWSFTGFTWEELHDPAAYPRCEVTDELLSLLDVLVDGRYVDELHDISLRFRGSSNQRIIDVPKTLQSGVLTLWDERANI